MSFIIEKRMQRGLGRAGLLITPRGVIKTPTFTAVGTKATVKALTSAQLKDLGVQAVLANTYHLYLEPGVEIIKKAGGLGAFMSWNGPTLTDSGGFQVFSLGAAFASRARSKIFAKGSAIDSESRNGESRHSNIPRNVGMSAETASSLSSLARIDDDGVTFKSHKDGSTRRFTPERSIELQRDIGADIIFAFDECASPAAGKAYQREAMERTHRWAVRCLERHRELKRENEKLKLAPQRFFGLARSSFEEQKLFGIVQGGRHEDLRKESARMIGSMAFDGFGIGGSFDKEDMDATVRWVNEILPEGRPRHLLGIGEPSDLFGAVENGCDLFDCVAPTRQARSGTLYTRRGKINIENFKYRNDLSPLEADCDCYACRNFSCAYIAHLFRSEEMLAGTLASMHNTRFIVRLFEEMRQGILDGTFEKRRDRFAASYAV